MASQPNNPVADALRAEAKEIASAYPGDRRDYTINTSNLIAVLERVANKIDAGKCEPETGLQERYYALWERHKRLQDSEHRLIKAIRRLTVTYGPGDAAITSAHMAISESVLENGGYQITK